MSARSNNTVPHWRCQFPFLVPVSKDTPAVLPTSWQPYNYQGCNHSSAPEDSSRRNSCWLEVTSHVLLTDPYLRFFVEDFTERRLLDPNWVQTSPFGVNFPQDHELYTGGQCVMTYLADRALASRQRSDETFQAIMEGATSTFRHWVHKQPDMNLENGMGDPSALIGRALKCLRLFVAVNWHHQSMQEHYFAYGTVPIMHIEERCSADDSPVCPFQGAAYILTDKSSDTQLCSATPSKRTNFAQLDPFLTIDVSSNVSNLQDALPYLCMGQPIHGKYLPGGRHASNSGVCDGLLYSRVVLQTLPWMLYIDSRRSQQSHYHQNYAAAINGTLRINTEHLLMGPTLDGKYGKYKLVARVRQIGAHFHVERRQVNEISFTDHNFERVNKRHTLQAGYVEDTNCCFLLWQRVQ